jgi:uncharacterized delta-60 repeat protein
LIILAGLLALIAVWFIPQSHAQGQVQVTAADPMAAEQGTINLNVKVTGKGFKNGANAKWFVTGTTNPGGVTVNSTNFVSSTELSANITVADTATIANFDIQVTNSDGRGGKGTELFAVTAKGHASCPVKSPAPILGNCYSVSAGCLDTTFGTSGQVATQFSGISGGASSVLIQTDGKIVGAGMISNSDFIVARYNTNGSVDNTFGAIDPLNPSARLGYNTVSFISGNQFGKALLQPDGKILVSGNTLKPNGGSGKAVMVVARFNSDGSLDTGFGTGGKTTIEFSSGANAESIAIQSDGKIVLAGFSYFSLARLNTDGSLDASFGIGGMLTLNASIASGGISGAHAVAIQKVPALTGEERILVGGYASTASTSWDFALMRFKPDGTIDPTFGNNGRMITDFFGFEDQVRDLALDASNRIVAGGLTYIASDQCGAYVEDLGLARYLENGSLDLSFNGTGLQHVDFYAGLDIGKEVAIQSDGKIVMVGWARNDGNTITNFGVVRLNADGSRDASFGPRGDGVIGTDFPSSQTHYSYANAVALQSDGKIVVGGTAEVCTGSGKQACRSAVSKIALARYWY